MGGFEASSHVNGLGQRVDMIAGTQHDSMALTDYRLLNSLDIRGARDALRWHLIDRGAGGLDFGSFLPQLEAACATGTQVIWSLCHYGYPDDIDLFSTEFIRRFVAFSVAACRLIREHSDDTPYFTPINEVSFFSWAASRLGFRPFAQGRDNALKQQLVRATIEACGELRVLDSRCRFVFPEPIIHVVAPHGRDDLAAAAGRVEESQFEAWDMIAGRQQPELGGQTDLLDIVGMNFYHSNQWEIESGRLEWEKAPRDPRWRPLSQMMENVWKRYQRPLFLAETSHIGVGRAPWILEVAGETDLALKRGVPVEGICLFPIIDRYDWNDSNHWHNSGLWDLYIRDGTFTRLLNAPYAQAIKQARLLLRR
ncbi:MAG: hypothetical protein K2X03_30940 [Bryobacteraceae bacterium]|nr:hypothetical protein [Bryobacteraceae bacterium]